MVESSGSHSARADVARNSRATSVRIGEAVLASRKPWTISVWEAPGTGGAGLKSEGRSSSTTDDTLTSTTGPDSGSPVHAVVTRSATRSPRASRSRVIGAPRPRAGRRRRRAGAGAGCDAVRTPARRGSVSRNWAPPAGASPCLQPAAVQVGVLERDRQPQTGAAAGAGPGRVGPPEPVEHHRRLPRLEADAVVADGDRRDPVVVGSRAGSTMPGSRPPPPRGRWRW